jgi:hypothetical protein
MRQLGLLPRVNLREAEDIEPKEKFPDLKPLKKPEETIEHGECPYVFGTPFEGEWAYCGRPSVGGTIRWCRDHYRACYMARRTK